MEDEIIRFLHGYGYGDGSGDGSGDGYGSGDGSGYGYGYGYGYGDGSGSGDGYGYGSGYGDGDGSGYSSGYGYGYGDGSGDGSGDGYGSGDGSGDGDGDGDGFVLKTYHGETVYYVDCLPCVFKSIHDCFASVQIIDLKDFTIVSAFIGKFENCFAHGKTIRDAIEDARNKYYQSLEFEEVKEKLLAEFKDKGKLTVKELYDWHGIITGSCRFGRSEFQVEHNLRDDDLLSLDEFVSLTENAFGGDMIRRLKQF